MSWVVFLRAVNVGGTNRCRPAQIAKQLEKFGVINIGAVGTFVVRESISESTLRTAIVKKLPFKCEIMIVPARIIVKLASKNPLAHQLSNPNIIRFVMVLHQPLPGSVASELLQTSNFKHQTSDDWLIKIITVQNRFVLGLYRRQMKAITYLGKIEKLLGVPATTRNWNTIEKIVNVLGKDQFPTVSPISV